MISFTSDETIQETMKYAEFFIEFTARVNKQMREFFFSVIHTLFWRCHLNNMKVIQSGKRLFNFLGVFSQFINYRHLWCYLLGKSCVHMYVFQDIFPFLHGSQTIQRNRLALADNDALEYSTFESITSKEHDYKNSKVMLFTFHAIWKHFKKHVYPTLPKNGMMLTEKECQYDEFIGFKCNQWDLCNISTCSCLILNIHKCIGH